MENIRHNFWLYVVKKSERNFYFTYLHISKETSEAENKLNFDRVLVYI